MDVDREAVDEDWEAVDEMLRELEECTKMDSDGPKIKITLPRAYHYFRSLSELRDCKHGGYLKAIIQIYGNSSRITHLQLQLVPSEDLSTKIESDSKATQYTCDVKSLTANLHCNLLYISTSSSNQRPDITESGWRINLQRIGETMILSGENHLYVEEDLDSGLFWRDSEGKLILGSDGLRVTIVKPLSKEDKASRPGIYADEVLIKRFEESLVEKYKMTNTELQNEKDFFYKTHMASKNRKFKECEPFRLLEYFTKDLEMYKAKLQVTCTFEDGTTINDTSPIIYATNKYIVEIDKVQPERVLLDGVCQRMIIVLKKCEPTLKMGIKAGFEFRPSDAISHATFYKHNKIRVLDCKRIGKGKASLEVLFQSFFGAQSVNDTIINQILTKQTRLFLVVKVFDCASSTYEDENVCCTVEKEVEVLTHPDPCNFHQTLKNITLDNHKDVLLNIFNDSEYMAKERCPICNTNVVDALKNLAEEYKINNQTCQSCTKQDASRNDQWCWNCSQKQDDVFNEFYKKLFITEDPDPSTSTKKPRLDHNLGR